MSTTAAIIMALCLLGPWDDVGGREVRAYVTGYNLVEEQTDDTPCIGASGKNLCEMKNTTTCPRTIPFGTAVEIDGMFYTCEDRTARKYDDRFDINCGQDRDCPYRVTGWKTVRIVE